MPPKLKTGIRTPGILGLAAGGIVIAGMAAAALLPHLTASEPSIGGPFALTNGAGQAVTDKTYLGRWKLVYFGYTHCPDACPTTLSDIAAALDKLPAAGRENLSVLFITVDPARDTAKVIGDYAKAFGPEFIGLTGTQAELAPVEQSFRVYAQKHQLKGGDYAMDHSSIIYVMAPDGHFVGLLDDGLSPAEMARRLVQMGA
jgi:protein SCO1/2